MADPGAVDLQPLTAAPCWRANSIARSSKFLVDVYRRMVCRGPNWTRGFAGACICTSSLEPTRQEVTEMGRIYTDWIPGRYSIAAGVRSLG